MLFTDHKFESAVKVVLLHEGLFTNNPNDPGGATNYGISLRFLRAAGIDGNMNRSDHVGIEDIKALNPDKAKNIYYKYFYKKYNINNVVSTMLATSLLDMSVLMGGNEAIKLLQTALDAHLVIDGILGKNTLAQINSANSYNLNEKFKAQCILHFQYLITKNEKLSVFLNGWTNRVDSL